MKNTFKNRLVIIILLLLSFTTYAQDGGPDEPLFNDPGVAPIGDYIPLLLIAAIGLAYIFIQKRKEIV